jgi:hypothetical protein
MSSRPSARNHRGDRLDPEGGVRDVEITKVVVEIELEGPCV